MNLAIWTTIPASQVAIKHDCLLIENSLIFVTVK